MMKTLMNGAIALTLLSATPISAQGQFLTAAEVKPILTATKGNWIAVREYNGQDLLYFSHLLAWRCGLKAIHYSLNAKETLEPWPLTPCNEESPSPAAIGPDQPIYGTHTLGSIASVTVTITYDDDTTDTVNFERKSVLIP